MEGRRGKRSFEMTEKRNMSQLIQCRCIHGSILFHFISIRCTEIQKYLPCAKRLAEESRAGGNNKTCTNVCNVKCHYTACFSGQQRPTVTVYRLETVVAHSRLKSDQSYTHKEAESGKHHLHRTVCTTHAEQAAGPPPHVKSVRRMENNTISASYD